ncbi:MAG: nitroreductase/quinone reductase family protein [Candidatus Bathyarchaeia archaeon]
MNPRDLEPFKNEKLAYLTTIGRRSGRSHTVELWFALANAKIYLSHEGAATDWMKNVVGNSRVSIKVGSVHLEAEAVVLDGGVAVKTGQRSLYEKYYGHASEATIDDWFELSKIIELTPTKNRG